MTDLIASPPASSLGDCLDAVRILGPAADLCDSFSEGDWAGVAVGAVGVASDVASVMLDPLGTMAASAAGFLLDHMPPLPDMLNSLAGNPGAVQAKAQTWRNVGDRVAEVSETFATKGANTTSSWKGDAGDAYRDFVKGMQELKDRIAQLAGGAAGLMQAAAAVVELVRTIVRDIIADLVGKAIAWAVEVGATCGIGASWVVPKFCAAVLKYTQKVTGWFRRLTSAVKRIVDAVEAASNAAKKILPILQRLASFLNDHATDFDAAHAFFSTATSTGYGD